MAGDDERKELREPLLDDTLRDLLVHVAPGTLPAGSARHIPAGTRGLPMRFSDEPPDDELDENVNPHHAKLPSIEWSENFPNDEELAQGEGVPAATGPSFSGPSASRPSRTGPKGMVVDPSQPEKDTFAWTVMQISKVILGTGILVLPRAFQLLGCALAILLMTLVGALTWFTINGLIYASERTHKHTFAAVVRVQCGRPAKWLLLASIFFNCAGMCVVFLVVYGDILVGSPPRYRGLIHDLLPDLTPDSWLLNRRLVVGVVAVLFLAPLSAQRDLHVLSPLALVGVASVCLFAGSTLTLTAAAAVHGKMQPLPWAPDWQALAAGGSEGGAATWGAVIMGAAGVVPLLLNADVCHQSVFSCMGLLKPYTRRRFNWVMACALTLCNVLYTVIALCCLAVFGTDTNSNVLMNLSGSGMKHLLGKHAAYVVALLIRVSYFVSLLGSFVFTLHPLRHCCLEMLLGSNFSVRPPKQAKATALFLPITFTLLGACYLIAMDVPGIWIVLQLVGSCASTFMGFIIPGLVILFICRKPQVMHYVKRSVAVVVIALGLGLFVNGFMVL